MTSADPSTDFLSLSVAQGSFVQELLGQADPADIDALPQELRDRYPEIVEQLRTGVLDEVPDSVIDQLPASVVDQIPDSLIASGIDPTFALVLGAIAVVSFIGFGFGVAKAAAKAAVFFLVVGAAAAFVLYTQMR